MSATPPLFTPFTLRGVTFRNRIAVSPMCQYSSIDGFATDWHLVHLGSRAVGGAALVIVEATAVEARGRISPQDNGIWKDEHVPMLARIAAFVREQGAAPGIQLAHAGRKASTRRPWEGRGAVPVSEGGWQAVAPSAIPFSEEDPLPAELSKAEIAGLVDAFAAATRRAVAAGFQVVEIHGAHGYLMHEFLSPLSNQRADEYGGSLENRMRFACEVTEAVRAAWPAELPLFLRISASDWVDGGWTIDDSVALAKRVRELGVDLVDCSSGGLSPAQKIELGPAYQAPFAERIRRDAAIPTGAVGLITSAQQANELIRDGKADLVLLARQFLRDPYFPLHAARELGIEPAPPVQYGRAFL
ncbi:MAG TPA: NADH:flavin oxidoreductase/NADH oxidase [Candidatus Sulfopaludibacter sp.]|jgi:2,4-dienoyl-CoA reductase-like NADH-dependent reductase (Old Yellow Enzyme family)|nr:NADH:flavin oxidoreductase/NADH oxidase [Candidatus Sulfopaludibacter sp.]